MLSVSKKKQSNVVLTDILDSSYMKTTFFVIPFSMFPVQINKLRLVYFLNRRPSLKNYFIVVPYS